MTQLLLSAVLDSSERRHESYVSFPPKLPSARLIPNISPPTVSPFA
jgi:hypothetical protein